MARGARNELDWNGRTVVIAGAVAVFGFFVALALQKVGIWPDWPYSQFLFAGLSGATAAHRLHPERPVVVLVVFGTVMTVLLAVATFLFDWYVLGESI